jgi:AraC-like DNA-binding protein
MHWRWTPYVAMIFLVQLAVSGDAGAQMYVPYRSQLLSLESKQQDWRTGADFDFAEDRGQPKARNRVFGKIAWEAEALWVVGEVQDAELINAPASLRPEQFHLFDVLQIYLDPLGDSGERMNADDLNILLLPDARAATLRGDSLLAELFDARVPQRAGAPLRLDYSTQMTTLGWRFVLRLPFAALGLTDGPGGGPSELAQPRIMRMDIAMQDWRISSTELAANADVGADALLSTNWSNQHDFGFPKNWRTLQLTGHAPWFERWQRRLGFAGSLTLVGGLFALVSGLLLWLINRRQSARLRALQSRIAQLQARAVNAAHALAVQVSVSPDASVSAVEQDDAIAPSAESLTPESDFALDPRAQQFAEKVLTYIESDLSLEHSAESLAAHFHVSVRTLQRRIKAGTGATPNELVLATRLNRAQSLLQSGKYRVSEAAFAVGFEDQSYFSRCYRRCFGVPPSQDAG